MQESDPSTLFSRRCAEFSGRTPQAVALVDSNGNNTSWSQWVGDLNKWAAAVKERGLGHSHVIAVVTTDPGDALTACVGVSFVARCLPIDARQPPRAIADILCRAGADLLFVDASTNSTLRTETLPPDCAVQVVSGAPSGIPCSGDYHPLPDAVAFLMETSGSTGETKIVPITHGAIADCLANARLRPALDGNDRCLSVLPLSSIHGLLTGCLLTLSAGGSVALTGRFVASKFLDWLCDLSISWFSVPPPMHRAVLDDAKRRDIDFRPPALRFVRSAAAPMPAQTIPLLEQLYGVPLTEAYGMTEALNISVASPESRRIGSVGPTIGPQIEIRDAEDLPVRTYATGRIVLRGPTVTVSYLDGSTLPLTKDGWAITGDIGWLDDDGYLYVTGREKEVVNRGGSKVVLSQVEKHMAEHPDVAEVAALAVPHDRLGDDIVAVVVFRPDTLLTPESLRRELLRRVPIAQVPSRIVAVDALPVTITGKIKRAELTQHVSALFPAVIFPEHSLGSNAFEEWVRKQMAGILDRTNYSIDEDFFAAGGDSLSVAALSVQLSDKLSQSVHPIAITGASTPRELARLLRSEYTDAVRSLALNLPSSDSEKLEFVPAGAALRPSGHLGRSLDLPSSADELAGPGRGEGKARKPIFILSAPRSGSTLLRAMLAGHPGLFAPPELNLAGHEGMASWAEEHSGAGTFFREGLIQAVMSARNVDFDSASAWVAGAVAADRPVAWVYEELQGWIQPRRLVDKTPIYAMRPAALAAMECSLGEPFYIHLTRHPDAFVRSYKRTHLGPLTNQSGLGLITGCSSEEVWLLAQRNILEFFEKIPCEAQIRVAYEDLIRNPEAILRKLCDALQIDYDPKVLEPYSEPDLRMLRGVRESSKMIGDPEFHRRDRVMIPEDDPGRSSASAQCHPETQNMAAILGYEDPGPVFETASSAPQLEAGHQSHQRALLKKWTGVSPSPDSWVVGRHLTGTRPPLIWCFQAESELNALAGALGMDQPVIGLRSGHMIFDGDHERMWSMAHLYCDDLLRPGVRSAAQRTPWLIGGNCGGGKIAWGLAHALAARAEDVALLILMEVDPMVPLPHAGYEKPVALIYGRQSERNPLLKGSDSGARLSHCLGDWTLDQIEGAHGRYFDHPHRVRELAALLHRRISSALSRNNRRS